MFSMVGFAPPSKLVTLALSRERCQIRSSLLHLTVFNFEQALAKAELWYESLSDIAAPDRCEYENPILFPEIPEAPPYTVGTAARDYLNWYRVHRRGLYQVFYLAKNQIIPSLGHVRIDELNPAMLQSWFDTLAVTPPIISSSRFTGVKYGSRMDDPEYLRKRKNTANNVLTYLKAILNRAFDHGYIDSDWAWSRVKRFKNVQANHKPGYLDKKQIHALLDEARGDATRLIKGGLLTGCRVGDLLKMKVGDYLPSLQRIIVLTTKTQNLHHIALSEEGNEFFSVITKGRPTNEPMFIMNNGDPWTHHYFRDLYKKAQRAAGIRHLVTFHMLRHTYASHAAMAGLPLKVIANQLGHTTTQMVDKFYAHLGEDYLDDVVREKMPRLFDRSSPHDRNPT